MCENDRTTNPEQAVGGQDKQRQSCASSCQVILPKTMILVYIGSSASGEARRYRLRSEMVEGSSW